MSDQKAPRILYCHCAYAQAVPKPVKQQVLQALTASGAEFEAVPDLCEMSAKRNPALKELAASGALTVVACYPRAVKWLFSAAGAPLQDDVRVLNMRTEPAEAVITALAAGSTPECVG
jgi:hypothetical protein